MEKINIAELLKNCPAGMELDCTICDNVYLDKVTPNMIKCFIKNDVYETIYFHHDGSYLTAKNAKCVIFPKGKVSWEGFHGFFKEGDIVVSKFGDIHLLRTADSSYCAYRQSILTKLDKSITTQIDVIRFATEEEKKILFKAIKDNGYKWNAETKTLEKLIKPKFKVGDRIKDKYVHKDDCASEWKIIKVNNDTYTVDYCHSISFENQDNYELVPNKFDINTLIPFESKVLVRDVDYHEWEGAIFGRYDGKKFFTIGGMDWTQCIPYKGNEWLFGTNNDCDKYYKTWEE